MKPSALASALALSLLYASAAGADLACKGPSDACTAEMDDPSALQLRAGQRELSLARDPGNFSMSKQEAYETVQEFQSSFLTDQVEEKSCSLTASGGGCPITDPSLFPPNKPTRVYPGGETQCLNGSFFFEVSVGEDLEKLHIHFQGGGACWDQGSYDLSMCFHNAAPMGQPAGVFNRADPRNPLQKYSFIVVQYCGGDMHAGNTSQPWGKNGAMVKQVGYLNANAAVQYALSQFPKLQRLVISGSSAGSLGAQLWSGRLIRPLRGPQAGRRGYRRLVHGRDVSGEHWLFEKFNMCNRELLTPDQLQKCDAGKLLVQDVFADSMESHRDARFGIVNSKSDIVQIAFEVIFEITQIVDAWRLNPQGVLMSPGSYYKSASLMAVDYLANHPNAYAYIVEGPMHTYLPGDWLYTTTPKGPWANVAATSGGLKVIDSVCTLASNCATVFADLCHFTGGSPALTDWLAELIDPAQRATRIECSGPSKPLNNGTKVEVLEIGYCAEGLLNLAP